MTTLLSQPIVQDVIGGLVVNAVTGAWQIATAAARPAKNPLELRARRSAFSARAMSRQALVDAARELGRTDTALALFLMSAEVQSLVLDAVAAIGARRRTLVPRLREAFVACSRNWPGLQCSDDFAADVFNAIVARIQALAKTRADDGDLQGVSLRTERMLRTLKELLQSIDERLDSAAPNHSRAAATFLETYRRQAEERFSNVQFQHIDATRRPIPLDDVYVIPEIFPHSADDRQWRYGVPFQMFRGTVHRTVLLGNPGAGKSTFAQKLCLDLARTQYGVDGVRADVLPILVVLREYGAWRERNEPSILRFIVASCLLQTAIDESLLNYMLHNGYFLVVFDGLDELLQNHIRRQVRDDVQSFLNLYGACPSLVTSRLVGYSEAPLDQNRYSVFVLGELSADSIAQYATKWFALQDDMSADERNATAARFVRDTEAAADVRRNPLMLSLMCALYKGERYIPRSRYDLYDRCSRLLFERWDRSRGIHVTLPFETHVEPAMHHLAHWIYADAELQQGVPERKMIAAIVKYLVPRKYEDEIEGEYAARQFVEFCRGRAWVLTDTGTNADGEALYQFTHRTFLEYFTALHLVRTHRAVNTLMDSLLPKIRAAQWDVVAELAIQVLSRQIEDAADDLYHALICDVSAAGAASANVSAFLARAFAYLVARPTTIRAATRALLEDVRCFGRPRRGGGNARRSLLLYRLTSAHPDNVSAVATEFASYLRTRPADAARQEFTVRVALDFLVHVEPSAPLAEVSKTWLLTDGSEALANECERDESIACNAWVDGVTDFNTAIADFGVGRLFDMSESPLERELILPAVIRVAIGGAAYSSERELLAAHLRSVTLPIDRRPGSGGEFLLTGGARYESADWMDARQMQDDPDAAYLYAFALVYELESLAENQANEEPEGDGLAAFVRLRRTRDSGARAPAEAALVERGLSSEDTRRFLTWAETGERWFRVRDRQTRRKRR